MNHKTGTEGIEMFCFGLMGIGMVLGGTTIILGPVATLFLVPIALVGHHYYKQCATLRDCTNRLRERSAHLERRLNYFETYRPAPGKSNDKYSRFDWIEWQ